MAADITDADDWTGADRTEGAGVTMTWRDEIAWAWHELWRDDYDCDLLKLTRHCRSRGELLTVLTGVGEERPVGVHIDSELLSKMLVEFWWFGFVFGIILVLVLR